MAGSGIAPDRIFRPVDREVGDAGMPRRPQRVLVLTPERRRIVRLRQKEAVDETRLLRVRDRDRRDLAEVRIRRVQFQRAAVELVLDAIALTVDVHRVVVDQLVVGLQPLSGPRPRDRPHVFGRTVRQDRGRVVRIVAIEVERRRRTANRLREAGVIVVAGLSGTGQRNAVRIIDGVSVFDQRRRPRRTDGTPRASRRSFRVVRRSFRTAAALAR